MVLVGNKCDLVDKRAVSAEEAQALADKAFHGKFFETSAKTTKNINEVFHDLVRYGLRLHGRLVAHGAIGKSSSSFRLPRGREAAPFCNV